jgi:hypothetical protein
MPCYKRRAMKPLLAAIPVCLLAACGPVLPAPEPVEIPSSASGNVILYVSNQSYDLDPVDITVRIDGRVVSSDRYEVDDQHTWVDYPFDLAPGHHELVAESVRGEARIEEAFDLTNQKWLVVSFWYYPTTRGGAGPTPKQLQLSSSDEPVYFP